MCWRGYCPVGGGCAGRGGDIALWSAWGVAPGMGECGCGGGLAGGCGCCRLRGVMNGVLYIWFYVVSFPFMGNIPVKPIPVKDLNWLQNYY